MLNPVSANIYKSALQSLTAIVGTIAAQKNVPVLPEAYGAIAERALDYMDLPDIYEFMALRSGRVQSATRALNRSPDLYLVISLYAMIGQLNGRADFTPQAIEASGETLMEKLIPADVPFYRWPDLTEMVARHYAGSIPAPLSSRRKARRKAKSRTRKSSKRSNRVRAAEACDG